MKHCNSIVKLLAKLAVFVTAASVAMSEARDAWGFLAICGIQSASILNQTQGTPEWDGETQTWDYNDASVSWIMNCDPGPGDPACITCVLQVIFKNEDGKLVSIGNTNCFSSGLAECGANKTINKSFDVEGLHSNSIYRFHFQVGSCDSSSTCLGSVDDTAYVEFTTPEPPGSSKSLDP